MLVCGLVLVAGVAAAPDLDRLLASFTQRWGTSSTAQRFSAWRDLVVTAVPGPESERLKRVNEFFNRHMTFGDDQVIWGQADYWATPLESLGRGAGDCEDFAIAKYFTLRMLGVESAKLRLIYVRARTGVADSTPTQAHMVLAYYARPDAEPLVLDNLEERVRPASQRPDLIPVYSFNDEEVWVEMKGRSGSPQQIRNWSALIVRLERERRT